MRFKVGDKVKVIRKGSHCFSIGQEIEIAETFPKSCRPHYLARGGKNSWYLGEEEVEGLNPEIAPTQEKSLRFNNGKASIFDTPLLGLAEVSKVSMYGRSKYNAHNWKKPTHATELLDCIFRHFVKVMYGLDTASDSKDKEMAHLAWNALAYLEKEAMGTLIDDRHKYPPEKIALLESFLMLSEDQKEVIINEEKKKEAK